MTRTRAAAGSALFFVLAPVTVAGVAPWWISRWRIEGPAVLRWAGAPLIAAGALILLDSFARFAWQGLGTPAPVAPTRHLVVTGLYRYVRNPMYVGVLTAIAGQGLLFGNAALGVYVAAVWLLFHGFVTGYEEPRLRTSFGDEYVRYREAVPRWIPRPRPWR